MMTRTLIQAVPWLPERTKRAITLSQLTDGEIVWDQKKNAMDTWRLVMAAAGDDAVIVLEDDVELAENWRERIEAAIAERPLQVIQFFSMRGADLTVGSRYEPGRTFLMNQCYYLPEGYARQLLEFADGWEERTSKHPWGYDIAMATWLQGRKEKYWLHVPSLVQHEPWESQIDTRRPRRRQSATFGDAS